MGIENWNFRQRPSGLWKRLLRFPVLLYRLRLGFVLGERLLLLTHRGRVSATTYQTPVEVVIHDRGTHEYMVCSGTGPGADWYQNISAAPAEAIQVKNRRWRPHQRMVSQVEAAERFAGYEQRHPRMARRLLESMGNEYDGSDAGRLEMMASMPMVAFSDRDSADSIEAANAA